MARHPVRSAEEARQNNRPSSNCHVASFYSDVGNAGDTFEKCSTCGTYRGQDCRLSEELIADTIAAKQRLLDHQQTEYLTKEHEARVLVKKLINERMRYLNSDSRKAQDAFITGGYFAGSMLYIVITGIYFLVKYL